MSLQVTKLTTFSGHKDCLYALAPLGSHAFVSAGSDGWVAQWEFSQPDKGTLLAQVTNTVYALCHLPETQQLVVGQNFEGIHLLDLASKQETRSLHLTDQAIFDIQHHAGKLFIACGKGTVTIVDLASFRVEKKLQFSQQHARCLAINPNWKEFAVGYSDHKLRVFSLEDYQLKYELEGHSNSVFSVCYSPDSNLLLSGGRDAHLKAWSVANNYELTQDVVAHMYTINHIAFREDGRYFATCSKDKSIKVWDAQRMKLLKVIDKSRHAGHGTSVNKLFWRDAQTLVSASDDTSVSVWRIEGLED